MRYVKGVLSAHFVKFTLTDFAQKKPNRFRKKDDCSGTANPGGKFLHKKFSPLRGLCPEKSACCNVREGSAMNPNTVWGKKIYKLAYIYIICYNVGSPYYDIVYSYCIHRIL